MCTIEIFRLCMIAIYPLIKPPCITSGDLFGFADYHSSRPWSYPSKKSFFRFILVSWNLSCGKNTRGRNRTSGVNGYKPYPITTWVLSQNRNGRSRTCGISTSRIYSALQSPTMLTFRQPPAKGLAPMFFVPCVALSNSCLQ